MKTFVSLVALAAVLAACSGADDAHEDSGTDIGQDGQEHAGNHHDNAMSAADVELAPLPDDGIAPVVDVRSAWIRPHPNGRDVTAAYFTAALSQGRADRLVGARIDGAERVELHGHTMDGQGMMRMRPTGPQVLSEGDDLIFAPGGLHLMVHGLAAVTEGEMVTGVLVFERSGEVAVEFQVRSTPLVSSSE